MGRTPCCDKAAVKKGPWSPDEDSRLREYIERNGIGGNWISLPSRAGLNRCGKSCRLRWMNYLRPDIKRGSFTPEEEKLIYELHGSIGTRTDNDIKNHWNTKLKKRVPAPAKPEASSSSAGTMQEELTLAAVKEEEAALSTTKSESAGSVTSLLAPKLEQEDHQDGSSNRLREIIDCGYLDALAKNLLAVDEALFDASWWSSPKMNPNPDSSVLFGKQACLPALTSPGDLKIDPWDALPNF